MFEHFVTYLGVLTGIATYDAIRWFFRRQQEDSTDD